MGERERRRREGRVGVVVRAMEAMIWEGMGMGIWCG